MAIRVEVTGDFLIESSLARVNRGLFGALARCAEIDLGILAEPTVAQIAGTSSDELLQAARTRRFDPDPDVTIRHRWPAVFPHVRAGAYVHMQPWEYGSLPSAWAEQARELADEVWCYSSFVASTYARAGVPEERIAVVPLGYDPQTFSPGRPPKSARLKDRCVFLYVGDTIARKGVDVAVNAYVAAFKPGDNVVLVVKDFGEKGSSTSTRLRDHVLALSRRTDLPPIVYIDTVYSDVALADLYRAATALVAPYRGEGFGLPILEAMASGIATIATRGGASDEFTTPETTLYLDASPVKLGKAYAGLELVDEAFLLEPSETQLVAAMQRLYGNPDEARAMGARGAEIARAGWTWEHGAARALERLRALAGIVPRSAGRSVPPGELTRFELKIASPGGEDGILLELFRRLAPADPTFVECVPAGGEHTVTLFLTRSLGWRGAVMEGDSAGYADFATQLGKCGVPNEFELLVLGPESDAAWARFGAFRPQVVVTPGAKPPQALAESCGYRLIGIERQGTSAFFVRDDLVAKTRFAPLTAPAS